MRLIGDAVEENVADPAAENDADGRPEDKIFQQVLFERWLLVPVSLPQGRMIHETADIDPGKGDAGDIGQRIPAQRNGADANDFRVDIGKGQDER